MVSPESASDRLTADDAECEEHEPAGIEQRETRPAVRAPLAANQRGGDLVDGGQAGLRVDQRRVVGIVSRDAARG